MELERLKGKVIVISGGTKGVGRAFAEVAGREGARVIIGGRDEKAGKEAGAALSIRKFIRFETGEGIEKKKEDFAADVAAQMNA